MFWKRPAICPTAARKKRIVANELGIVGSRQIALSSKEPIWDTSALVLGFSAGKGSVAQMPVMEGISVLIPHRNAPTAIAQFIANAGPALAVHQAAVEMVVIDDDSRLDAIESLFKALAAQPTVRILRLRQPHGAEAAMVAGMKATSNPIVIAIDPSAGYGLADIDKLLVRLSRHDFVIGRRRFWGWRKYWHVLFHAPAAMLRLRTVHDPGCFCWAARREAIPPGAFGRGMLRMLPLLVSRHGYRIDEAYLSSIRHRRGTLRRRFARPLEVLATLWLARADSPVHFIEIGPSAKRVLRIDGPQNLANLGRVAAKRASNGL